MPAPAPAWPVIGTALVLGSAWIASRTLGVMASSRLGYWLGVAGGVAMLALFGGLPDALVDAYDEVHPLADGWRDRITLHQLYPLAAHACLFGGGYGAQVKDALQKLVQT